MPLADFNADLDEIQGDFPSTLIVGTRLIPCVKSSLTHEVTYDETGYFLPETWEVVASRRDFADVPEPRQQVTLDGVACNVTSAQYDTTTGSIVLNVRKRT
jgi:hypothetical protein